mgnify:CR=1 FL=1
MYRIQKKKRVLFLTKNEEVLYEFKYHKWSSSKGDFYCGDQFVSIKPRNMMGQKFDITKDNTEVGEITFNWKGQVSIEVEDGNYRKHRFFIRSKGFWKSYYEILNADDKVLFRLKPKFVWKAFGYNFDIEIDHFSYNKEELALFEEIFMYVVFGVNVQMSQASGAA